MSHQYLNLRNKPIAIGLFLFIAMNMLTSTHQAEVTHHKILITQFSFVPAQISVKPGDKITWVNQDMLPHNITAISNSSENKSQILTKISLDLMKADKFTTMVTKGFDYLCGFHPSMKGVVTLIEE